MIGSSPPFAYHIHIYKYKIINIHACIILSIEYARQVVTFCLEAIKRTAYRRRSLHRQAQRFGVRWFGVRKVSDSEKYWNHDSPNSLEIVRAFSKISGSTSAIQDAVHLFFKTIARCCPCSVSMNSRFLLGVLIWSWKNLMIGCWYLGGFLYQYPK